MPYLLLMSLGEEKWKIRYNRLVLLSVSFTCSKSTIMALLRQVALADSSDS